MICGFLKKSPEKLVTLT